MWHRAVWHRIPIRDGNCGRNGAIAVSATAQLTAKKPYFSARFPALIDMAGCWTDPEGQLRSSSDRYRPIRRHDRRIWHRRVQAKARQNRARPPSVAVAVAARARPVKLPNPPRASAAAGSGAPCGLSRAGRWCWRSGAVSPVVRPCSISPMTCRISATRWCSSAASR